jgi:protein kinase A
MKVLRKSEVVRLKQVEHINSERTILERIRHPFVVELYATYQDSLNVYMLLSYIPGGELFSHLRRAGRFSADVTRFYLASIVLAIDYLHAKNIIYRDLKPENLLLDRVGYLRIADFGFAKVVEDRTFTLCGTPEYLAPEIVLSQGHGKAVDWWALGILAFEMLAGYPPFFDDHTLGIYEKILRNEVAFPSHVDPYAKDLIRGLLTADRSKRLGNLRGGAKDVMGHPWFAGVDWGSLERKEIGAPIIPRVSNMGRSCCIAWRCNFENILIVQVTRKTFSGIPRLDRTSSQASLARRTSRSRINTPIFSLHLPFQRMRRGGRRSRMRDGAGQESRGARMCRWAAER